MTTAFDRGTVPNLTIADRMLITRRHAGYEQSELADLMGVSRGTISNAEQGKGEPQRTTINLWAMACGVPASWLRTGEHPNDDPDPNNGLRIISTQKTAKSSKDACKIVRLRTPAAQKLAG